MSFRHGKRTQDLTDAFMWDLRSRLTLIPEMVTDGLVLYEPAVARSFGLAVDYAVLVKTPSKRGKESTIPFIRKRRVVGAPDMDRVSTSYVERMNLTIRTQDKRFARRTNAHSKKLEHHEAHFALLACWYNLVRVHSSLETTPAVRAGIASEPWTMAQLLEAVLCEEPAPPLEPKPLRPRVDPTAPAKQTATGSWLRLIDGGKGRPSIAKAPAGASGAGPVKVVPPKRLMKQLDLFELD